MSGIKLGSRVHVEFDGEVLDPLGPIGEGRCLVYVEGTMADTVALPESVCTVIAPPVKVGDTVTLGNLERMAPWSIAAKPNGFAMTCGDGGRRWYGPNGDVLDPRDVVGATVLRVGGAS